MDLRTIAHLGRFKDIVTTLVKYGFQDVVDRMDMPGKSLLIGAQAEEGSAMTTNERIRHALEDLGPTFIKLGQIMSLRLDLLPASLVLELSKLQDEVRAFPFEDVREMVERSLGRKMKEVFSYLEEEPLAAASLAQVHRAILAEDGTVVAVKVQRPGIRKIIETDLYILETLAGYLNERLEIAETYDIPGLVEEFRGSLYRELDFARELRNMKMAARMHADDPDVQIPAVFERYSGDRMLVMELVRGVKLREMSPEEPRLRESIARIGLRASFKQVFQEGFFHADPHPGNLVVMDGRLCILDWGMVGRINKDMRFQLLDLIEGVAGDDEERVVDEMLKFTGGDLDAQSRRKLNRQVRDLLDTIRGVPISEVDIGSLIVEGDALLREHHLKVPADLAIMTRAMITSEGSARLIYPGMDVIAEAEPFVAQLLIEKWKPGEVRRRLGHTLRTLDEVRRVFPKRVLSISEKIEEGKINVGFYHRNLDNLRGTLDTVSNRLAFAIICAALIVASSMIITTGVEPLLFGYPVLGVIGYVASGVLGLWLLISIIRSKQF